jgi:hypothetical protein
VRVAARGHHGDCQIRADVAVGSFAIEPTDLARPLMSASPPKRPDDLACAKCREGPQATFRHLWVKQARSGYARFKSQFRKTDVVIGLDLSSAGGDFEEGVQIANLAHEKKLSVYVAEECISVCAFVFFAATKRYLGPDSRIGVHSISNSRDIEDLSSMRLTLKLARLSAKLGVPKSAIGKLVTTRPSNITYLDAADLSGLDTSVGNPFHYQRPEKSSGAAEQQQQSCSG